MIPSRSKRVDAISNICNIIDNEYVKRLPASDEQTLERWEMDSFAYLTEGFRIRPIQVEHRNILDSALAQWKESESKVLYLFDDSHDAFAKWFSSLRASIWREKSVPIGVNVLGEGFDEENSGEENFDGKFASVRLVYHATEMARGLVTNIGWCRGFGAFLPLAVPDMRPVLAQTGVMMASTFYLELIAKVRDTRRHQDGVGYVPLDSMKFEKIDAIWRKASELRG